MEAAAVAASRGGKVRIVALDQQHAHIERGLRRAFARNGRRDGLLAASLRVKLPHLDGWNDARRGHAAHYRRLLEPAVRVVEERPETPSVHHLFPARFENRDAVAATLREFEIESGMHYYRAVDEHRAWANSSVHPSDVQNAEAWAGGELSLPMHPDLTPGEIERVAGAVRVAVSVPNARSGENRC
jgi:dTDP-4-amino-4,6-dideoxygalactose transaminase